MGLVFSTGTINAANAGAVGQAMVERIRDDLIAHAAWELVEEYTPASIMKWYVFKCLAASSGLPVDYYVIFGRVLGSGELHAFICEGYNAGTHVASLYPATQGQSSSTLYTYDAQGRQTHNTFTLGIAPLAGSNAAPRSVRWAPSGVSTKWWLIIDDDGFSVAFNGASNGWMHFGKYDWLGSMANACPLHSVSNDGYGLYHGVTRNPAVASSSAGSHATSPNPTPGSTSVPFTIGFAGRLDRNDKLANDQRPVAELPIFVEFNTTLAHVNGSEAIGYVLGKVKRMRYGTNPPAGVAFGDAYAHNGTLWVPYLPSDGRIWDTGVAV